MAFSNGYTFGFAFAICVVCSTALATVAVGLKDRQEANARRDLQKNILVSLGLPEDGRTLHGPEVDEVWASKVEVRVVSAKTGQVVGADKADLDGNGVVDNEDLKLANAEAAAKGVEPELLGLFVRKDNGTIAVPMEGDGLWGPISGYVAFDPQVTEVQGATFFAPKETPGLGAEITNAAFTDAWKGKSVVDGGKTRPVRVLKGPECKEDADPYCVDGISGATITSRGVDEMLAQALQRYEPYFQTVR